MSCDCRLAPPAAPASRLPHTLLFFCSGLCFPASQGAVCLAALCCIGISFACPLPRSAAHPGRTPRRLQDRQSPLIQCRASRRWVCRRESGSAEWGGPAVVRRDEERCCGGPRAGGGGAARGQHAHRSDGGRRAAVPAQIVTSGHLRLRQAARTSGVARSGWVAGVSSGERRAAARASIGSWQLAAWVPIESA